MNIIDEKLIQSYVILVLADKHIISEDVRISKNQMLVPKKYVEEVEIRVAERTIEVLSNGV